MCRLDKKRVHVSYQITKYGEKAPFVFYRRDKGRLFSLMIEWDKEPVPVSHLPFTFDFRRSALNHDHPEKIEL